MCGRFTIAIEPAEILEEFGLEEIPSNWVRRYNVAPSQRIPVLTRTGDRKIEYLKWGLIPSWAKDPAIGNRLINARAETILEKPSFRNAFAKRRCLVLADGFYEWKRDDHTRSSQPYRFTRKDGKPFAFAGLWETWRDKDGCDLRTAAIITCPADSTVRPVHDRMPVILSRQGYWAWLADAPVKDLLRLLVPLQGDVLSGYPVSLVVNKPEVDHPGCIERV